MSRKRAVSIAGASPSSDGVDDLGGALVDQLDFASAGAQVVEAEHAFSFADGHP